jgi:hypothetical protein
MKVNAATQTHPSIATIPSEIAGSDLTQHLLVRFTEAEDRILSDIGLGSSAVERQWRARCVAVVQGVLAELHTDVRAAVDASKLTQPEREVQRRSTIGPQRPVVEPEKAPQFQSQRAQRYASQYRHLLQTVPTL